MNHVLTLLRPKQYIKNFLVFSAIFFSFSFGDVEKLLRTIEAFVCFCLAASAVYIMNDIIDVDEDKQHPEKRHRPLASGSVDMRTAYILLASLSVLALILSGLAGAELFFTIGLYIVINVLYSLKVKRIAILDIVFLSFGFLLRIIAGGVVTNIPISMWLVIMTFLLAVFLGIAKRREDVRLGEQGLETRKNISQYNLEFINATMVLMAGVIIVSYLLYTVSSEIQLKFSTNYLYITSLFVIVGILRYMQIIFVENGNSNPTDVLYRDRFIQIDIALWIISFYLLARHTRG
jgi:decaprenyl-phosphate phosphoribosyltransferase